MRVIAISGSRNPEGQTAQATDALLRGVVEASGEVARYFLPTMKIERCRQCDMAGWGICVTEGRCVVDDDVASLMDEMRGADLVVFATPVYYGDLSESMKAFLDRVRRVSWNSEGRAGLDGKPAVGICVAGGGGGGSYSCAQNLDRILLTCGFDVFDVVPIRRQNLEMKVPLLEGTGRWIAERK